MYEKKIKIEAPLAKPRFLLITNYDKLLHISLSFMLLAFLYKFVGISSAFMLISVLWLGKEVIDRLCGDKLGAIVGDLIADVAGGLMFGLWYYFS